MIYFNPFVVSMSNHSKHFFNNLLVPVARMSSGDDIDHRHGSRIFNKDRFIARQVQRLPLLQHRNRSTGQGHVALERKNDLLVPLARLELPSGLAPLQDPVEQVTSMATCFL